MTCIVATTHRTWQTIRRRPSALGPLPFVGVLVLHLPSLLLVVLGPVVDRRRLLVLLDLRLQGRLGLLLLQRLILLDHCWETSRVCLDPFPIALGSLFLFWSPCRRMLVVVLVGWALFLDESRRLIFQ